MEKQNGGELRRREDGEVSEGEGEGRVLVVGSLKMKVSGVMVIRGEKKSAGG